MKNETLEGAKKFNVYRWSADAEAGDYLLTLVARGVYAENAREALEKKYDTSARFFDRRDFRVFPSGKRVKLRGSLSGSALDYAWERAAQDAVR